MKSYAIRTVGNETVLDLVDAPKPEPRAGEVRLRMRAAALNRGEFIAGHGLHSGGAKTAGIEGAGEVDALGAGVTGIKVGDRVMGRCTGAFAEYALMHLGEVVPMPARLSWVQASCASLVYMTVHDMLIGQGRLRTGEWLLVTGVSSGVGVAAVQVGNALGAKVIGTSGSSAKLERLKPLGLAAGIVVARTDAQGNAGRFCDEVMRLTDGKGVNLIVNNVGGSVFAECIRSLAFEGRMATVGYVDGVMTGEMDIEALHAKRLQLFGVSNKLRTQEQRTAAVGGFVADVLPFIADGRIDPVIDRVFDFAELPEAKRHMESNAHLGKIVVRIGG
ncbi:MAG: zinc-binding alcohol dehydrogenase [Betaproteobacteria bacterium]|nr:zinc-binding alcohol dehydrogenase [Betaproteobacteria bacterium]